jgi:hypothetical protein
MEHFNIYEGKVYYHKNSGGNSLYLLKQADAKTFQELNHFWGVDAKSVFAQTKKVKGADRDTFQVLNALFARDKTQVFSTHGPIADADPKTFEVLDSGERDRDGRKEWIGYARDEQRVYFHDLMWGKAKALKADPKTFRALSHSYAVDATSCYHCDQKVKKADPKNFELLSMGYARSDLRCFYNGHEFPCAEPESLRALEFEFAIAGRQVFLSGKELAGADAETFRPIFSNLGGDAQRLFCWEYLVKETGTIDLTVWRLREMFRYLLTVFAKGCKITVDGQPLAVSDAAIEDLCQRSARSPKRLQDDGGFGADGPSCAVSNKAPQLRIARGDSTVLEGPIPSGYYRVPVSEWRLLVEPCLEKWCAWYPDKESWIVEESEPKAT